MDEQVTTTQQQYDIGATLRAARETKGVTVERASQETNIRRPYIEAVEQNAWQEIPGVVFVKGILRTYGNYLGLDGAKLVEDYKVIAQGVTPDKAASEKIRETKQVRVRPQFKRNEDEYADRGGMSGGKKLGIGVLVLAVVAMLAGAAWFVMGQDGLPIAAPSLPSMGTTATTNPEPSAPAGTETTARTPGTDESAPVVKTSTTPAGQITLELKGKARCWLEVSDRDKSIYSGMLQEGEASTFSSENTLEVTYGYPPGVEITLNGERQPDEVAERPVTRRYTEKAK